jgi:simple sugar transport system ATP-binding protein
LIPPDRQRQGLALSLSIRDNLLFDAAFERYNRKWDLLSNHRLDQRAEQLREKYDIRASDLSLPASSLSGGNQQKIVIARALSKNPKIVLAASPTRGLDVAATEYVHSQLRKCRDEGAAIILISTELDEIIALADQIAVLYEGCISAIVPPDTPREKLGLLMGGKTIQANAKEEAS